MYPFPFLLLQDDVKVGADSAHSDRILTPLSINAGTFCCMKCWIGLSGLQDSAAAKRTITCLLSCWIILLMSKGLQASAVHERHCSWPDGGP